MRPRHLFVAAGLGASQLGCGFILDFDELQASGPDAGTGGAGNIGCVDNCNDNDPCTVDVCDRSQATPRCEHQRQPLVNDGFSVSRVTDPLFRVTMAAAGDRFFMSTYGIVDGEPDVQLFGFKSDDTPDDLVEGPSFTALPLLGARDPVSAAGLAVDSRGLDFDVHAYVAVGSIAPNQPADVFDIVLDENLGLRVGDSGRVSTGPNYDPSDPRRYPIAFQPGPSADVYAIWIGADGAIYLHQSGTGISANQPSFGSAAPAQYVAPIGLGTSPGAVWGAEQSFAQILGGPATAFEECLPRTGIYTSSTSTFTGADGVWGVGWSKLDSTFLGFEQITLGCGGGARCVPLDLNQANRCESSDVGGRVSLGTRNPVSVLIESAQPGRLFQVTAAPFVDFGASPPTASIVMNALLFELGNGAVDATVTPLTGGGVPLATQPATSELDGPDWPAIAFADDRVAIAWIQPAGVADSELRVERFRLCAE